MPKYDTLGDEKFCNIPIKELKEMMKIRNFNINGTLYDLRKRYKNTNPLIATRKKYKKLIKKYIDKPIRLLELL